MHKYIKFNIKNYKNGDFVLYVNNYDKYNKVIIKDLNYIISKINFEVHESLRFELSNYQDLRDLFLDIVEQSENVLNIEDNYVSKEKVIKNGFVSLTVSEIVIPIKVIYSNINDKIKLELKFKNVLKDKVYICKANEPCKHRISHKLIPYNACCGICELKDTCLLVCNDINKPICFDKEEL